MYVIHPDDTSGTIILDGVSGGESPVENWFARLAAASESCWSTDPTQARR